MNRKNEIIKAKWEYVFKVLNDFEKEENYKSDIVNNLYDQLISPVGIIPLTSGANEKFNDLFYAVKKLQNMQHVDQLDVGKALVIYLYEVNKK